ncbi:MAG TPA: DUF2283 domain-containing protein [Methanothrix sp.]|nr:DUF2283 domain-containing protein [Methanothrix sp.]HOK59276.1 DUF2283 domain-containing protein [Methanothrix sp.]HOL44699.1 DUF2283 domain-containing protein [Methanothrix sp.]HPO89461.1 DUF2283 domain-containing protein [Methanothrix sp.]
MYLKLLDGVVAETVEVEPNILIDYGEHKEVLGIEIINASGFIKANPLEEIVIKVQERARA